MTTHNVIRGTFHREPASRRRGPLDGGYLATPEGGVLYLGDMLQAEHQPAEGEELRITIESVSTRADKPQITGRLELHPFDEDSVVLVLENEMPVVTLTGAFERLLVLPLVGQRVRLVVEPVEPTSGFDR